MPSFDTVCEADFVEVKNAVENAAKEIAGQLGRSITFMAKYDMAEGGSSCHIHSSVWSADGSTPLMYDEAGTDHMSDVFRGWLGDRSEYAGFKFGDLSWQADRSQPVGVNKAARASPLHSTARSGSAASQARVKDPFGFVQQSRGNGPRLQSQTRKLKSLEAKAFDTLGQTRAVVSFNLKRLEEELGVVRKEAKKRKESCSKKSCET